MRRTVFRKMTALLFLLSLAVSAAAEGTGALLSGYELYQIGGTEVVLELSGRALPEPNISFEDGRVRLVLAGVRSELKVSEPSSPFPLISGVRIGQSAGDAVIEIFTQSPLHPLFHYGEAHRCTFRMTTAEPLSRRTQAGTPGPALPLPPSPSSEERLSLDLRDIELRDLFRALGRQMGRNIIIDPSFPSALVTMSLKDAPAEEIFRYLTRAYGISAYELGDALVLGTQEGLARLSGAEEPRPFPIAYADPVAVQGLLVSLVGIPSNQMAIDLRLRTLYVTAHPEQLNRAAQLIRDMDQPGRQVMIHARVFEFSEGALRDVETALNAVYDHWWFSYSSSGGGEGGYISPLPEGVRRELDVTFQAIEAKGKGKTLANPSVITLDGQEAKVSLTEEYPYISARDEAGNPTWSTTTVGPQLTIVPKVGRDGLITLQLTVKTGDVIEMITGSGGEKMPRTSTRSVTTNIRVRNGEPFVLGGLFRENRTNQRVRIPIVGQIPLLGELFSYRTSERSRTQVVILVAPYILGE